MDKGEIRSELMRIKNEVEAGRELDPTLWKIVKEIKSSKELTEEFADQVGEIDQRAFLRKVRLRISANLGIAILLLWAALSIIPLLLPSSPAIKGMRLIFAGIFLTTLLHGPSHFVVGRLLGIRFTYFFLNGPMKIEPTLKTEYATYLRVPSRQRVLFHLCAPVMTSYVVPAIMLLLGVYLGVPRLARYILLGILLMSMTSELTPIVLTEYLKRDSYSIFNFRRSDYARALREWRVSRTWT